MDEEKIRAAISNPANQGEMEDADAEGTVGSPECGDMVRMWLKYKENEDGAKVIDRASFQSFGCQTAMAVASVATELLAGKTVDEAMAMKADELAEPLGALPPMKIHCGQMVEGALREALGQESGDPLPVPAAASADPSDTLLGSFTAPAGGAIRIVDEEDDA